MREIECDRCHEFWPTEEMKEYPGYVRICPDCNVAYLREVGKPYAEDFMREDANLEYANQAYNDRISHLPLDDANEIKTVLLEIETVWKRILLRHHYTREEWQEVIWEEAINSTVFEDYVEERLFEKQIVYESV